MLNAPEGEKKKKRLTMDTDDIPSMMSTSSSIMTSLNSTTGGDLNAMIEALLRGDSASVDASKMKRMHSDVKSLAPINEDSSSDEEELVALQKALATTQKSVKAKTPVKQASAPSAIVQKPVQSK